MLVGHRRSSGTEEKGKRFDLTLVWSKILQRFSHVSFTSKRNQKQSKMGPNFWFCWGAASLRFEKLVQGAKGQHWKASGSNSSEADTMSRRENSLLFFLPWRVQNLFDSFFIARSCVLGRKGGGWRSWYEVFFAQVLSQTLYVRDCWLMFISISFFKKSFTFLLSVMLHMLRQFSTTQICCALLFC